METIIISDDEDKIEKIKELRDQFVRKATSRISDALLGELVKLKEENGEKKKSYYQRRFFF